MSKPTKLSPTAVQVGDFVYIFKTELEANQFLYCIGNHDLAYCEGLGGFQKVSVAEYKSKNGKTYGNN